VVTVDEDINVRSIPVNMFGVYVGNLRFMDSPPSHFKGIMSLILLKFFLGISNYSFLYNHYKDSNE
jgi:hypothetical protein